MADHDVNTPPVDEQVNHPGPAVGSAAFVALSDPNHKIDMWGPQTGSASEGFVLSAPRKKKRWGLPDVGWVLFVVIATQVVLLPFLVILAVAQYDLQLDTPEGLERLPEALADVATTGPGLVFAVIFQSIAFVSVPVWATYRKGHRSLAKDFGLWFKPRDLPLGLGVALAMQVVLFGFVFLLNQTSLDLSDADNTGQVTDQVGLALVFMILAATIGAPLTEELLFRGLILRSFLRKFALLDLAPVLPGVTDQFHPAVVSDKRRKVGVVVSVLLSSVLFGVMHAQAVSLGSAVVIFQTGFLGLVFALVAVRTRRLGVNICAHFCFNSISIALALLTASGS